MDNPLQGMSQEDIQQLKAALDGLDQGGEKNMQQNAGLVTVELPDGSKLTGTQEQVQAAYQRMVQGNANRSTESVQNQPPVNQPSTQWNQEEWGNVFIRDSREGLKQAFKAMYGFDPGEGLLQVAQVVKQLSDQNQQLAGEVLALRNPQFANPQTMQKVREIVKERGWAENPTSLQDAYDLAKARGVIQEQQPVNNFQGTAHDPNPNLVFQQPQAPPYVAGGSYSDVAQRFDPAADNAFDMTAKLSTDEIRRLVETYSTQKVSR